MHRRGVEGGWKLTRPNFHAAPSRSNLEHANANFIDPHVSSSHPQSYRRCNRVFTLITSFGHLWELRSMVTARCC